MSIVMSLPSLGMKAREEGSYASPHPVLEPQTDQGLTLQPSIQSRQDSNSHANEPSGPSAFSQVLLDDQSTSDKISLLDPSAECLLLDVRTRADVEADSPGKACLSSQSSQNKNLHKRSSTEPDPSSCIKRPRTDSVLGTYQNSTPRHTTILPTDHSTNTPITDHLLPGETIGLDDQFRDGGAPPPTVDLDYLFEDHQADDSWSYDPPGSTDQDTPEQDTYGGTLMKEFQSCQSEPLTIHIEQPSHPPVSRASNRPKPRISTPRTSTRKGSQKSINRSMISLERDFQKSQLPGIEATASGHGHENRERLDSNRSSHLMSFSEILAVMSQTSRASERPQIADFLEQVRSLGRDSSRSRASEGESLNAIPTLSELDGFHQDTSSLGSLLDKCIGKFQTDDSFTKTAIHHLLKLYIQTMKPNMSEGCSQRFTPPRSSDSRPMFIGGSVAPQQSQNNNHKGHSRRDLALELRMIEDLARQREKRLLEELRLERELREYYQNIVQSLPHERT